MQQLWQHHQTLAVDDTCADKITDFVSSCDSTVIGEQREFSHLLFPFEKFIIVLIKKKFTNLHSEIVTT